MSILDPGGYVRARAPELVDQLDRMKAVAATTTAVAPELDLCRIRLAQLHGDSSTAVELTGVSAVATDKLGALASWWESDHFSPVERACLAFTEQFVLSVSAVSQSDVDALLTHWPEQEVYDFVMALYVLDLSSRGGLVLEALFSNEAPIPASTRGA